MAVEGASTEDHDEASRLETPRWVTPALYALAAVAAIGCLLTGRVVMGLVIAAIAAVTFVVSIVFRSQLRGFTRRRTQTDPPAYGALSLFGIGWMVLGVWNLTLP